MYRKTADILRQVSRCLEGNKKYVKSKVNYETVL